MEVDLAAAELAKAQAEVAAQAATVSKCVLTAPFAGKVAALAVHRYQFVQIGQRLMDIVDDSALDFALLVPAAWIGRLRPGLAVRIVVAETGGTIHEARIVRLGAAADPVSRTIKVMGELTARPPILKAGMTGRVLLGHENSP